jgi:hypothetical protein
MQEEDDENEDDFESEKEEESTGRESYDALPGPGFVRPTDRKTRADEDELGKAIIRLSVAVEAMEVPERAASQATARGAFTDRGRPVFFAVSA